LTFDDPRRDPVALAWAKAVLAEGEGEGDWARGYARLVRLAGGRRPPGRQPGAARAALERGEAAMTPSAAPGSRDPGVIPVRFEDRAGWPDWVEGVAIVRGTSQAEAARNLVRDLAGAGTAAADPVSSSAADPDRTLDADALLADLLGASLVEARYELTAAWAVLDSGGRRDRAEMWMTQAPPWPPASVEKILRSEPGAMAMLETLAAQLSPAADTRAWLLRSWIAPGRTVDGRLLDELAAAVDGRLVREPRFRGWLRGEWTAWARQRYRRVARQAATGAEARAIPS
jgi:hypothetical protein